MDVSRSCVRFPGDYCGRVTPDPIPNSVVKPSSADGTAGFLCGRVGRRQGYGPLRLEGAFFIGSRSVGQASCWPGRRVWAVRRGRARPPAVASLSRAGEVALRAAPGTLSSTRVAESALRAVGRPPRGLWSGDRAVWVR